MLSQKDATGYDGYHMHIYLYIYMYTKLDSRPQITATPGTPHHETHGVVQFVAI